MSTPDTILCADSVVTVDPARPDAQAVAIADGRITAVGSREELAANSSGRTQIRELGDVCVLPGLIEPHTHPDLCAECYSWIDVSGFTYSDVSGVETALRTGVREANAGEWLFAFGLDPMLTPNLGRWDRARLDEIAPHNPLVVMIQSMHTLFVNSLALSEAGVDDDTPDPPGGGRYQRDADGHLTGKCVETTSMLPFLRFVDRAPETLRTGIWNQYGRYAKAGLTTIGMPGLFSPLDSIALFEELGARADVPVRNVAYLRHFQVEDSGYAPGQGSDTFRIQGAKLWYDGSPYSGTMLLDEPYLDSRLCCCTLGIAAGSVGHANFEPAELVEIATRLHRDGWQVLTHAQGDRAAREALDLYEQALAAAPRRDHRWRLEHCALIDPADLSRALRLGVTPSFHVNHVHYYGPELRDAILGVERSAGLMPIASALSAGHRVSLHADSPMYPPEPFRLMQTAVTRAARDGSTIGEAEAISVEQALRAITIDAAWQLFRERDIGSLEVGKLADFTIVDRNPLCVDPQQLSETRVLGTWLGGREVC
jgi:hypothetical protein